MTKVKIESGVCGFVTTVEAVSEDGIDVVLKVTSGCEAVRGMFQALGDTFDPYELCLVKPGTNPLYEYAAEHFPSHGGCVVIAGVTKATEVECKLALPRDASITFVK